MKGTDIINVAREQLKAFIAFEIKNIFLLLNGKEPEDGYYTIDGDGLHIPVEYIDTYTDCSGLYDDVTVSEIYLDNDENVYFVPIVDEEYKDDDIEAVSIDIIPSDKLAEVANSLERRYLKLVKK